MIWSAEAPSNLALIKYMGKQEKSSLKNLFGKSYSYLTKHLSDKEKEDFYFKNLSLNPSLSFTLNHFVTKVQIKESETDTWTPFEKDPFHGKKLYKADQKIKIEKNLSKAEQKKFLDFFQFLKKLFLIEGHYNISSQNNFPMSAGTASSASSFSALTQALFKLAKDRSPIKEKIAKLSREELAFISRAGSGSSCRSFFSPWTIWQDRKIESFTSPWSQLVHQLILTDDQNKKTSSTKAHELVRSSPLFPGRADRVKKRIGSLLSAFQQKNWEQCFLICYEEFMDMHSLFETASPPLKYKTADSQKVLNIINQFWKENKEGPLVTMDAGANVHLLYRLDQNKERQEIEKLLSSFPLLSSL